MMSLMLLISCLSVPAFSAVTESKDCAKLLAGDVNSCTLQLFLMTADGKFSIPKDAKEVDTYCSKAEESLKCLTTWQSCLKGKEKDAVEAHIIDPIRETLSNVCHDAAHRSVMHSRLSCFQKSVPDFDTLTTRLMRDMNQVQGLDPQERKNAYCCLLESFYDKFRNVSGDGCKAGNWEYLEMILDPLIVDLPEAICEVTTGSAAAAGAATAIEPSGDHCAGLPQALAAAGNKKTAGAGGAGMAILPFLLQLMSQS